MAKKFGKILLLISTIGAAFAGAYYFMKNRKSVAEENDDYEDLDDDSSEPSEERSYVSLNSDTESPAPEKPDAETADSTAVEEFFDDDDDDTDGSLDAI